MGVLGGHVSTHCPVSSSSIVPSAHVHPVAQISGHIMGLGLAQVIVPPHSMHSSLYTIPGGHRLSAVQW